MYLYDNDRWKQALSWLVFLSASKTRRIKARSRTKDNSHLTLLGDPPCSGVVCSIVQSTPWLLGKPIVLLFSSSPSLCARGTLSWSLDNTNPHGRIDWSDAVQSWSVSKHRLSKRCRGRKMRGSVNRSKQRRRWFVAAGIDVIDQPIKTKSQPQTAASAFSSKQHKRTQG